MSQETTPSTLKPTNQTTQSDQPPQLPGPYQSQQLNVTNQTNHISFPDTFGLNQNNSTSSFSGYRTSSAAQTIEYHPLQGMLACHYLATYIYRTPPGSDVASSCSLLLLRAHSLQLAAEGAAASCLWRLLLRLRCRLARFSQLLLSLKTKTKELQPGNHCHHPSNFNQLQPPTWSHRWT